MIGCSFLPIDLFKKQIVVQNVVSYRIWLLVERENIFSLEFLPGNGVEIIAPNNKVYYTYHELNVR